MARPATDPEPYSESHSLGPGSTIGLMANGFTGSVEFLDRIEAVLGDQLEGVEFRRWNKGNASRLATEEELNDVAGVCDAVIGAYGH